MLQWTLIVEFWFFHFRLAHCSLVWPLTRQCLLFTGVIWWFKDARRLVLQFQASWTPLASRNDGSSSEKDTKQHARGYQPAIDNCWTRLIPFWAITRFDEKPFSNLGLIGILLMRVIIPKDKMQVELEMVINRHAFKTCLDGVWSSWYCCLWHTYTSKM